MDYFIKEYAPSRDAKNRLDEFEGFIFRGPEYLTMFDGLGRELETIPYSKREQSESYCVFQVFITQSWQMICRQAPKAY